ncbi:MAG: radical SAM protein [Candidatus Eisenbacteria bacterium]|nr:radical SAM protein [Candidatus Eisenbacteria bacterium]
MRKLRIGVIDLVTKRPARALYARLMNANLASIMPQAIAVWCEEDGHDVKLVCHTGYENLVEQLPQNVDLVFIGAFTEGAQMAYALSNLFRMKGAVTVLGGPHARCYPQDAQKYFDYVLGFTDKTIIRQVLHDCSQHRPIGVRLDAGHQPESLPGVRERWKFIASTLQKARFIKIVPMLGSLGCPYTCSFCIDAAVPYQPMDFEVIKEDLRFLLRKFNRPRVVWHDPNFGVRFNEHMDAIEEAVPPNSIDFIAESSLSLLAEPNLKRLKRNGFKGLLPGIESWYELSNKSNTGATQGMDKVRQVSDHINMIMRYIPYVQANFVLGLDVDNGSDPFELTKRFVDMSPGVFPGYSLLSILGQAARLNLEYQRDNRVIPFPFHFLNNNHATNVRPKNYSWPEFYDHVIDLTEHSFSWRAIFNRHRATGAKIPKLINLVRGVSSGGVGMIKYHTEIRRRLDTDLEFRRFFEQETTEIPQFYVRRIQQELGPLWEWLPEGALHHDPNAYLKAEQQELLIPPDGRAERSTQESEVTSNLISAERVNVNPARLV